MTIKEKQSYFLIRDDPLLKTAVQIKSFAIRCTTTLVVAMLLKIAWKIP